MKLTSFFKPGFSNLALYVIAAFSVVNIGCSSGGGDGSSSTPAPPSGYIISGFAVKGPLTGATVTAFELANDGAKGQEIASTGTNTDGSYSLDIGSYTGNVIVEVTNGSYTDEATNTPGVQNNAKLRVVLINVQGNVSAQATPLTEMATQIAETTGGLTSSNIHSAQALISNLIGGVDIVTTVPANTLANCATQSVDAQMYGLMLATISQWVHDDGSIANVTQAINAFASDLAIDHTLNAFGDALSAALNNFQSGGNSQCNTLSNDQLNAYITVYTKSSVPATGFSMDDLAGTWNYIGLASPTSVGTSTAYFVDAGYSTFQNTGSYISNCLFDSIDPCGSPMSGSGITINANGFIPPTGTAAGEINYGFMSAGKNLVATIENRPQQWQRMSIALKRANSYSLADLEGKWINLSLSTPLSGGSINDHGFEVLNLDIDNAGSVNVSCIASSDICFSPQTQNGFTISNDGFIVDPTATQQEPAYIALSSDKNILAAISNLSDRQKITIALKQAASYTMSDLAGTWVGISLQTPVKDTAVDMTTLGSHAFGVGRFVVEENGHLTFVCTDASDGCASPINGTGFYILADGTIEPPYGTPPQPGDESEYWAMSANKDVMVDLFLQHGDEVQSLNLFLKLGGGVTGTSVNFADYAPLDAQNICTNSYVNTVGTGIDYTSTIVGSETIPYTSGTLVGTRIESKNLQGAVVNSAVIYNDGVQVKVLSSNDRYLSTDCSPSAPPAQWSFDKMSDGLLISQKGPIFSLNKTNLLDCVGEISTQKLLVHIQDVTVQNTTYPNAVIWYYLDLNFPYATLNFSGKDSEYGITLPTSLETQTYSVTGFDIYAANIGQVAGGDVDAQTGNLVNAYELNSRACP